jgi:predicted transcriptional regulator
MAKLTRLGDLERAVMDHLWSSGEPQTVRQVHEALSAHRDLAYTTIMTVLQRLAKKNLVVQHRDDRAHRYAPMHGRDELVAGLMVDALDQAADSGGREAALVHFVERVGADEAAALRRALAELETKAPADARSANYTADARSANYTADARSANYTEFPPAGNSGTG